VLGLAVVIACLILGPTNAVAGTGTSSGTPGVLLFESGQEFRCVGPRLADVDRTNPGGAAAAPTPVRLTDSVGGTTVSLTADTEPNAGEGLRLDDAEMVMTDDGRVEFSGPLNGTEISRRYGWSGFKTTLSSLPTLCVVRFSASSPPVVLVDQFVFGTGNYNGIEAFAPAAPDVATTASIVGTVFGLRIMSIHGVPVIRTVNANWDIGGPGFDGMPVGLLSVIDSRFENVTARYPAVVARDASQNWKAFTEPLRAGRVHLLGYVTAWAGDECELARGTVALNTLRHLQAEGRLTSRLGGPQGRVLLQAVERRCPRQQLAGWPAKS
jgi:hypothetical protein